MIQKRGSSIRYVLSQPAEEQSICTATPTTLQQLREHKAVLLHALEIHEQELQELRRSDRVQLTRELKIAIPILYAEKQRLIQATEQARRLESIMRNEGERLRAQIAAIPANEKAIDDLQMEIDNLTEKLFAYKKSDARIANTEELMKVHRQPACADEVRQSFQKEIETLQQRIDNEKKEIDEIQQSEHRNIEYLSAILQQQVDAVKLALNRREAEQHNPEEDERFESAPDDRDRESAHEAEAAAGGVAEET